MSEQTRSLEKGEGITITIYDAPSDRASRDIVNDVARLRPQCIWVDTAGPGLVLLRYFEDAALPVRALPKLVGYGDQEAASGHRLLNARYLVERCELALRDGSVLDERVRRELLADIEALKGRC